MSRNIAFILEPLFFQKLQVAESALPQDKDLEAYKEFLRAKGSLKPGQSLSDNDYVKLMSSLKKWEVDLVS